MTMTTHRQPIALPPVSVGPPVSDMGDDAHIMSAGPTPRALTPREVALQLPFMPTDPDSPTAAGSNTDQFRMLADFQDVIDSAADAGLIDDEAAVVFHRQLIAWSRAATTPSAAAEETRTPDHIIAAAEAQAADIVEDARAAVAAEVAQVRSLTIAECDEILAAARGAAARLVDDAMADALS